VIYECLEVIMEIKDWAKLQEELLKAQIGVLRNYLRSAEPGEPGGKVSQPKSRSHISIIIDLLSAAGSPLHVSEIIKRANEQHGVSLDRESVVSALTKKVKKGDTFVRTGPNIFGLKEI
jgi:hypothetical protein